MKPSEILKAHEVGLKIEWKYAGDISWSLLQLDGNTRLHALSCPNTEYRIKREPRTFWVVLRNTGDVLNIYDSEKEGSKRLASLNGNGSLTRYQPYSIIKTTENL